MKNLKLILGLVVVMMTTIGVKGQHTVSLTLEDFDVVSVVQYDVNGIQVNDDEEYGVKGDIFEFSDTLYIQVLNNLYDIKTVITIKSKNGGYGLEPNEINHTFVPRIEAQSENYEFIDTNVYINQVTGEVTGEVFVELTLIGMGSMFLIEMQQLDLVYDDESTANIFEHEQTNTTVTSYNKELTIKSSEYQNVDVQIYNMGGQMVNTLTNIELGYSDTKINMYDNPNGVYFVLVKDNYTGKVEKHKVDLR